MAATTTTEDLVETRGRLLLKPLKGLVFVVLWALALALWITAPFMVDPAFGAFFIDAGIVLASVGFAALFLERTRSLAIGLIWGVIALILFAVGDFVGITWLVYTLRMLVPFLAVSASIAFSVGRVRVFA